MAGSIIFFSDEAMISFRPRITKNGNLRHFSWIMRKSEHLGAQFKTCAETVTGVMMISVKTKSKDNETMEK